VGSRRRIAGGALVALLVLDVSAAHADLPVRRLAGFAGIRRNHGGLGADFPWGLQLIGAEAALLPFSPIDDVRLGFVAWAQISRYNLPAPGSVNPELSLAEMGLGVRADWRLPIDAAPLMAHVQLAGEWYRASNPIPPDDEVQYFGGAFKVGLEWGDADFFWGLGVSTALLPWMPASTTLLATVGVGGR
jgi:hypothetical protein